MITHTAFDWLFPHALLSIKTSTSFLKGSNRVIAIKVYSKESAIKIVVNMFLYIQCMLSYLFLKPFDICISFFSIYYFYCLFVCSPIMEEKNILSLNLIYYRNVPMQ